MQNIESGWSAWVTSTLVTTWGFSCKILSLAEVLGWLAPWWPLEAFHAEYWLWHRVTGWSAWVSSTMVNRLLEAFHAEYWLWHRVTGWSAWVSSTMVNRLLEAFHAEYWLWHRVTGWSAWVSSTMVNRLLEAFHAEYWLWHRVTGWSAWVTRPLEAFHAEYWLWHRLQLSLTGSSVWLTSTLVTTWGFSRTILILTLSLTGWSAWVTSTLEPSLCCFGYEEIQGCHQQRCTLGWWKCRRVGFQHQTKWKQCLSLFFYFFFFSFLDCSSRAWQQPFPSKKDNNKESTSFCFVFNLDMLPPMTQCQWKVHWPHTHADHTNKCTHRWQTKSYRTHKYTHIWHTYRTYK